jgi:hypothetical protein
VTEAHCDICGKDGGRIKVPGSTRLLRCQHCGFMGPEVTYHWHDAGTNGHFITNGWHLLSDTDVEALKAAGADPWKLLRAAGPL